MSGRFSCARLALRLDEPRYGTASLVTRWLLVEQPGPWGADAVLQSRLDRAVAVALKARASHLGARLLLIRRQGSVAAGSTRVIVAASTARSCWMEAFEVGAPAELLDLDLAPLARHRSVGGRPLDRSIYLVCTNGSHDTCCAEFGKPLTRSLEAVSAGRTWESSHVGGDRFAGNVVCLPQGVYYGHVGPLDARRLVAAHDAGLVLLDHYRGRSCMPFVAQAADYFVRRDTGLLRLDDLRYRRRAQVAGSRWDVWFTRPGGVVIRCRVEVLPASAPQHLTCTAARPARPPRYRLIAVEQTGSGAPPQ